MALKSKIEWTESTWNPITGCSKISDGCQNCYASRLATRLQRMGNPKYVNGFKLTLHEDCLNEPYSWKKPSRIFVNSMSDLFHADVPLGYIQRIFDVMNNNSRHIFQVLTKRAERLRELAGLLNWTNNIWLGVTVENAKNKNRIDCLRNTPANIKFISFEPLIDDVGPVNLEGVDWAIIGGESGWSARPIQENWIINIKKQCEKQGTHFYFKQWGGTNKRKTGRVLLGKTWDDMPNIPNAYCTP
ncbi:MAG: phage Gp37/Gp68 family protein [Dehalococcoidia bacterium]|nr:phage Gp37/Gp68 family protein [Dehalococcoidia bacterium]